MKVLKKNKFNVVFSHLENRQDFFEYEPKKWDIIISNPPWSIKDKVLKRCYELNKPFGLILPIHSLSGKYRWSKFKDGNIQLLISKNRICFNHKTNNKHNRPLLKVLIFVLNFYQKIFVMRNKIIIEISNKVNGLTNNIKKSKYVIKVLLNLNYFNGRSYEIKKVKRVWSIFKINW